jgi:hypothetical protein
MSLKTEIEILAQRFADGVFAALRHASLEDMLDGRTAGPKTPPAKTTKTRSASKAKRGRVRRSPSDLAQVTGLIVAKLREHRAGLRSEQLQKVLKLGKRDIVGPLTAALAAKKIVKTGEKRATTYFAR